MPITPTEALEEWMKSEDYKNLSNLKALNEEQEKSDRPDPDYALKYALRFAFLTGYNQGQIVQRADISRRVDQFMFGIR